MDITVEVQSKEAKSTENVVNVEVQRKDGNAPDCDVKVFIEE